MPVFSPPATMRTPTDYVPVGAGGNDPYYPASLPLRRLMGRYRGELKAPNVYKLVAGGYTDDGPTGAGQPYDWPFQGAVIAFTYYGGHSYVVSDAEAALLTAAGYGAGVDSLDDYSAAYAGSYG